MEISDHTQLITEIAAEVRLANTRIRNHVRESYLEHSPYLSRLGGANVYLKLENLQYTGSFKVRGAFNKLLAMSLETCQLGCVAASTGNHGAAVAYATRQLDVDGIVFVPDNASPGKVRAIERHGGVVRCFGADSAITEAHARSYAEQRGMTYISPYNDRDVIAGQGTIGLEIHKQLPHVDAVLASVGGGGLISGIGGYLKLNRPQVDLVGCSPINSPVMVQSIRKGRILDLPSIPTLSDGTAGGIEPGAITFEYCRKLVDDYEVVSEEEIGKAIKLILKTHHLLIEGSAGVAVASYLKRYETYAGKNVIIVICGGNLDMARLSGLLNGS